MTTSQLSIQKKFHLYKITLVAALAGLLFGA